MGGQRRAGGELLSFYANNEGKLTGLWINFRGFTELEDVRFKDNTVTFTQKVQFKNESFKGNFEGKVEGDNLSGILTHGGSQSKMTAKLTKRIPPAVGDWELYYKVNEHDIKATLSIKPDKEGELTATWQASLGEHKILDLNCSGEKIIIKRHSKIPVLHSESDGGNDMDFNSIIEGTIKTDTIAGTIKSDLGEDIPFEGKRMGSAIIGTWILDTQSPWGNSKQRLKVYPDMTGMYGINPVDKITLDGDKVNFTITPQFGRMRFEMNFEGKIEGDKLTGELKNQRGNQTVTGKKIGSAI